MMVVPRSSKRRSDLAGDFWGLWAETCEKKSKAREGARRFLNKLIDRDYSAIRTSPTRQISRRYPRGETPSIARETKGEKSRVRGMIAHQQQQAAAAGAAGDTPSPRRQRSPDLSGRRRIIGAYASFRRDTVTTHLIRRCASARSVQGAQLVVVPVSSGQDLIATRLDDDDGRCWPVLSSAEVTVSSLRRIFLRSDSVEIVVPR